MERERCGAVGSRTADFMWRSILRSDWSLSVSDCDLIYSELALLTIKYFYSSWTSRSELLFRHPSSTGTLQNSSCPTADVPPYIHVRIRFRLSEHCLVLSE